MAVAASVTVTPNRATLPIPKTITSSYADADTTLADRSANAVARDSSRRRGSSQRLTILSLVNVSIFFTLLVVYFILSNIACNCFGHSDECEYNPEIDHLGKSLDIHGNYEGGGVCLNCKHNTQGINCDQCKPGFFRPYDKPLNATDVCQRE